MLLEFDWATSDDVVVTTIHKMIPEVCEAMPELNVRMNIVLTANLAHRSQYGFCKVNEKIGEVPYGAASNLSDALLNAPFIGLTVSVTRSTTV